MESNATSPVTDRRIWVRILYMLFFWLAYSIAELLIAIVAIFQAAATVFTGHTNDVAHRFGKNLTVYVTHILEFVTFNSEDLAFPFADWPSEDPTATPWTDTTAVEDVDTYATETQDNESVDEVTDASTEATAETPDGPFDKSADEQLPSGTDNATPKPDESR